MVVCPVNSAPSSRAHEKGGSCFNAMHLLGYLALSFLIIGIYDVATHWPFPFRVVTLSNLIPEYLLSGVVLLLSYSSRSSWKHPFYYAGLATVLTAYASFDIYWYYFKTAPRPSDLLNTALLWDFAPAIAVATLLTWSGVAAFYLVALLRSGRQARNTWLRLLALAALVGFVVSPLFERVLGFTYNHVFWSDVLTVKLNGRFATFVRLGAEERAAALELARHVPNDLHVMDRVFPGAPARKPNIYGIVLESMLDPRLVRGATFNRSPLADEMRSHLADGEHFNLAISPIYGGKSVNAEFELLTGLPSLSRIASVDFNVMHGSETDGFVRRLKRHGYATYATKAANSSYFNVRRAYKSLGFDNAVFLGDLPRSKGDEPMMFDGTFFEWNLRTIRERNAANPGPKLHYMVGMYGHFPYTDDPQRRPVVIESDYPNPEVRLIANQFYHRTRALGRFLGELRKDDPEAIIFVISDHLPPVLDATSEYVPENQFANVALLLDGGRFLDVSGLRYYEITQLIWDSLAENPGREPLDDNAMADAYLQLLSASRTSPGR